MKVEVVNTTIYTVDISDEDVKRIKRYIDSHRAEWRKGSEYDEYEVTNAISELDIELYGDNATESDSYTENIQWSEYEDRTADEILREVGD